MTRPTETTPTQRDRLLANPATSHLARPGPHKTLDGRILPALLSSAEMTAWALTDAEPKLWRLLGHRPKPSAWSKKRIRKDIPHSLAKAMREAAEKESEDEFNGGVHSRSGVHTEDGFVPFD